MPEKKEGEDIDEPEAVTRAIRSSRMGPSLSEARARPLSPLPLQVEKKPEEDAPVVEPDAPEDTATDEASADEPEPSVDAEAPVEGATGDRLSIGDKSTLIADFRLSFAANRSVTCKRWLWS